MFKRAAAAAWTLLAIVFAVLLLAYINNENAIYRYDHGHYEQNPTGFLGITQPYVNHFNRGNIYYQLGDYDKAITEYKKALVSQPPETYDCRIRVNYALALVTPIDVRSLEEDDLEEIFDTLDEARTILTANGCADDENTGHYRPAQILKNEIDDFEQALKDMQNGGSGSEDPTPTPTPPDTTDTPTPTPDSGGSPTPTPQEGGPTPTPTPGGQGEGTPTPTPGGQNPDTPTPTPGTQGGATPTPAMSPEDQIRDVQDQAWSDRAEHSDYWAYDDWNFGDTASW